MPEYILPVTDRQKFEALPEFVQGYIEAAFFTECHCDNPELESATAEDLAAESLSDILADCAAWQAQNATLLEQAYARDNYSPVQAGRDYWFTRNGHGVGFWDRGQLSLDGLGDKLSDACRHREVYVYRGDDRRVYFS